MKNPATPFFMFVKGEKCLMFVNTFCNFQITLITVIFHDMTGYPERKKKYEIISVL